MKNLLWFLLFSFTSILSANEYIDVHVHIRGTTTSGILGNSGSQNQNRTQQKRKPPFMRGGRKGRQQDAGDKQSKSENFKKAVANLIKKMDRFNVEKSLVVVVPGKVSNKAEYNMMKNLVAKYPDRLGLLAGGAMLSPFLQKKAPGDVTSSDKRKFRKIATQIIDEGAVGFGEMLSYHLSMANHHSFQYAAPNHPLFLLLADIAAEKDVAIDIHMEAITKARPMPANLKRTSSNNPDTLEPTIPDFEKLLKHNRKARIVWQHIGWDNTGDMTAKLVGGLLSKHKNLYIALRVENRTNQVGNGGKMPNRLVDSNGKLKPEWIKIIKKYSNRITIGSDEFFFPIESERPNQSFKGSWKILEQLSPDLRKKIGSTNPRKIYRLN